MTERDTAGGRISSNASTSEDYLRGRRDQAEISRQSAERATGSAPTYTAEQYEGMRGERDIAWRSHDELKAGLNKGSAALDERRLVARWLRGFTVPSLTGEEMAMRIECCKHHEATPCASPAPTKDWSKHVAAGCSVINCPFCPVRETSEGPTEPFAERRRFTVELGRETDGRWIADVTNVPGAMAYGDSRAAAMLSALTAALWAQESPGPSRPGVEDDANALTNPSELRVPPPVEGGPGGSRPSGSRPCLECRKPTIKASRVCDDCDDSAPRSGDVQPSAAIDLSSGEVMWRLQREIDHATDETRPGLVTAYSAIGNLIVSRGNRRSEAARPDTRGDIQAERANQAEARSIRKDIRIAELEGQLAAHARAGCPTAADEPRSAEACPSCDTIGPHSADACANATAVKQRLENAASEETTVRLEDGCTITYVDGNAVRAVRMPGCKVHGLSRERETNRGKNHVAIHLRL